jgi:3-isopropylmalate/(R)-2-methylmalate dehydratase large subunit
VGDDGAMYMEAEYGGEAIRSMDVSQRMAISYMAIEMGGKACIIEPDTTTEDYLKRTDTVFNT